MPLPDQIVAAMPEDQNQSMPTDDFSIAFHVGAHKTATSHLQRSLLLASDQLIDAGVRYYGPEHFRLPGRTISALFGLRPRRGAGRSKRSPQDQLALMRKSAQRLVFSEENFIGTLANPRRQRIEMYYPRAEIKVSRLAQALGRPIDVFLGIRNPAPFLNSVYSQQLLGGKILPLEEFLKLSPVESVDWVGLVQRLRAVPEVNNLVVWTYEEYNAVFDDVCAALCGADVRSSVSPIEGRINPRLSTEAVAETLVQHDLGEEGDLAQVARKKFPVESGHKRFDGFSVDQHAAATQAYEAQIEAISALEGVTMLSPRKE